MYDEEREDAKQTMANLRFHVGVGDALLYAVIPPFEKVDYQATLRALGWSPDFLVATPGKNNEFSIVIGMEEARQIVKWRQSYVFDEPIEDKVETFLQGKAAPAAHR